MISGRLKASSLLIRAERKRFLDLIFNNLAILLSVTSWKIDKVHIWACFLNAFIRERVSTRRLDQTRGFAFVTFDDYDAVDRCILAKPHIIRGKELDVRKAIPRDQISRLHNLPNNKNLTPDRVYPPQLVFSHPSVSTSFYSSPYVSKLTSPNNSSNASFPKTFFLPPEWIYPSLFSPPLYSSSSSVRAKKKQSAPHQNENQVKNHLGQASPTDDGTRSRWDDRFSVSTQWSFSLLVRTRTNNIGSYSSVVSPWSRSSLSRFDGRLTSARSRTTDETLTEYVAKFGEVTDALVMKDQRGQSKCFGFVTFADAKIIDEFMKQRPHTLDGRQIDPKRASKTR